MDHNVSAPNVVNGSPITTGIGRGLPAPIQDQNRTPLTPKCEAKMEIAEAIPPHKPATTTHMAGSYGCAAPANYTTVSSRSSKISGCPTVPAKPQLRVPPVTNLVKSNSDLPVSTISCGSANSAFQATLESFQAMCGNSAEMYVKQTNDQNPMVRQTAVQVSPTDSNKSFLKLKEPSRSGNGDCSTNLHVNGEKVVSTPVDSNNIVKPTLEREDNEDDFFKKLLKTLKKKSKILPFPQFLPDVMFEMQNYPTKTEFQFKCVRLIQPFLPQKLSEITTEMKANLVETVLTCLQANINDESIVDCCTDLLAKLKIFADPIDKYTKTVEILLKLISNPEMTTNPKSWTIWLLIQIVAKSDENRQNLVVQMCDVQLICEVIRQQLNNPTYGRILAFSWNRLADLCVDSLENKKKLVSIGGVHLFHHCYEKFGDEAKMVEKMMETMVKLSSYPSVRPQLQFRRNFEVFWNILHKFNDNVAIGYRCAYVFDNFLSDSATVWPLDSPTVDVAKNFIYGTIGRWNLEANIIERSTFKKDLQLLKLHMNPLIDLLLIWTFANLTTVDAPKYCRMLSEEKGVEILTTEVILHRRPNLGAPRLAKVVLENIKKWKSTATQQ